MLNPFLVYVPHKQAAGWVWPTGHSLQSCSSLLLSQYLAPPLTNSPKILNIPIYIFQHM